METVSEADEEHSGHRTQANEEAGSIVLNVGQDMDERKTTAISVDEACHEGEATMERKREETNGKLTENVIETDCLRAELPGHRTQANEEAGSVVLHVGHDMNEKEKNDRLSGAVCFDDEIMMEFKQEEIKRSSSSSSNKYT